MPNSRKKLYEALSNNFDIGTYDEFDKKMNDPQSRQKLYNHVSQSFDLGSYDEFESKIGGKKKYGSKSTSKNKR